MPWLKRRTTGIALWLLLLAGLAMIVYPRIDASVQERKQLELLTDWRAAVYVQAAPPAQPEPVAAAAAPEATPAIPLPRWQEVDGFELLGSLNIPKIELQEPIVRGADARSLKKGAGSVVEGRWPGLPGNFVLAGHRGWTFGRHFNRLGELEIGDEIGVDTTAGEFRYVVTDMTLVEPDDLSVLDDVDGASVLTLITCHPKRNPTHRLIVRAEMRTAAG